MTRQHVGAVLALLLAAGACGDSGDVALVPTDIPDAATTTSAPCDEAVCPAANEEAGPGDADASSSDGSSGGGAPGSPGSGVDGAVDGNGGDAQSSSMDSGSDAGDAGDAATNGPRCVDGACAPGCPCAEGGVCTSDDTCAGRLRCGVNNGAKFGLDPAARACEDTCIRPKRSGVEGVYYNAGDNVVLRRGDGVVDFSWPSGTPTSAIAAGDFRARWDGTFEADVAGSYSLCSENGRPGDVITMSLSAGGGTRSGLGCIGPISLGVGDRASFNLDYKHYGAGAASIRLAWRRPSSASTRVLPRSAVVVDGGEGLDFSRYSASSLREIAPGSLPQPIAPPTTTKIDPVGAMHLGAQTTDGSLYRWNGQVQATVAGSYRICASTDSSDDRMLLTVVGAPTLTAQGCTAPITLAAGERRGVRLDYIHGTGAAGATLEWRRPAMASNEPVPTSALFPLSRPCECSPDGTCAQTKCTTASKCFVGQGPCLASSDCASGTVCRAADGARFGVDSDVSMCVDLCAHGVGTGASAEYFSGGSLDAPTGLVASRIEPTLSFDWSSAPPTMGMSTSGMVARFSANLRPDLTSLYEVCVVAPGAQAARLTVGEVTRLVAPGCATLALDGMRVYPLRAELLGGTGTTFSVTWRAATAPMPVAITRPFMFTGANCDP